MGSIDTIVPGVTTQRTKGATGTDIGTGPGNRQALDIHLYNRRTLDNLITVANEVLNNALRKKTFAASTNFTSVAGTAETECISLENPGGSGKYLILTHMNFGNNSVNARTVLRYYKNATTLAAGTVLTAQNLFFDSPQADNAAGVSRLTPTTATFGEFIDTSVLPAAGPSRGINRTFIIPEGSNLLMTAENSVGNTDTFMSMNWIETNIADLVDL